MNFGDTNIQSIAHGIHETTKIMWRVFAHFMFIFGEKIYSCHKKFEYYIMISFGNSTVRNLVEWVLSCDQ